MPSTPPTGRSHGRTKKHVDWEFADKMLEAGCTGKEIAAYFDMHHETFYDRVMVEKGVVFTEYQAQKRCKGDLSLRSVQYNVAVKDKDKSMLIWLGKQRLGQKEPESTINVKARSAAEEYISMMKEKADKKEEVKKD